MQRHIFSIVGFLIILIAFTAVASTEESIKEGKWEVTMVTKIEGLPQTENIPPEVVAAMNNAGAQNVQTPNGGATISTQWNAKGMTSTVTQCITNENVYPNAQTSSDCERTQQKDGNTYRFHVICNRGGDQTEETSSFTYTGDTMNGVATIHGKEVNTTTQFTGKYIGPCQ